LTEESDGLQLLAQEAPGWLYLVKLKPH
jgi:hypothetical protein